MRKVFEPASCTLSFRFGRESLLTFVSLPRTVWNFEGNQTRYRRQGRMQRFRFRRVRGRGKSDVPNISSREMYCYCLRIAPCRLLLKLLSSSTITNSENDEWQSLSLSRVLTVPQSELLSFVIFCGPALISILIRRNNAPTEGKLETENRSIRVRGLAPGTEEAIIQQTFEKIAAVQKVVYEVGSTEAVVMLENAAVSSPFFSLI